MASYSKLGKKYLVRWRDPDGRERTRRAPDLATAKSLKLAVESARALGRRWTPPDADLLPELLAVRDGPHGPEVTGGLIADYLEAAETMFGATTVDGYDRCCREFVAWLAARHGRRRLDVDLLTRDALQAWYASLILPRGDDDCRLCGRPKSDPEHRHRGDLLGGHRYRGTLSPSGAQYAVSAVQSAWVWAYDSDTYGELVRRPRPPRLPGLVKTPSGAPTWRQMDALIAALWAQLPLVREVRSVRAYVWRARLVTLARFTGLRIGQVLRLRWSDVDLERGSLVVRGELGKSARERGGREVPLPSAMSDILARWVPGRPEAWLVSPDRVQRRPDFAPMSDAWRAATVNGQPIPERVWRTQHRGREHHCLRAGYTTGLAQLGVPAHVRDFLTGHHRGVEEHYLDTWAEAVEHVAKIPALHPSAVEPADVSDVFAAGGPRLVVGGVGHGRVLALRRR